MVQMGFWVERDSVLVFCTILGLTTSFLSLTFSRSPELLGREVGGLPELSWLSSLALPGWLPFPFPVPYSPSPFPTHLTECRSELFLFSPRHSLGRSCFLLFQAQRYWNIGHLSNWQGEGVFLTPQILEQNSEKEAESEVDPVK